MTQLTDKTGVPRLTVTVEEAGAMLGLSRQAAYDGVRRGDIPSIQIGRRRLVPVSQIHALLGLPEEDAAED